MAMLNGIQNLELPYLQKLSSVALVIAATVAIITMIVTVFQLYFNRKYMKQAATKTTYREYLKLATKYPNFGDGNFDRSNEIERTRYEWFVSFFLLAAEEVLENAGSDKFWLEALKEEAGRHSEYLNSDYIQRTELNFYSKKLQKFIRENVKPSKSSKP